MQQKARRGGRAFLFLRPHPISHPERPENSMAASQTQPKGGHAGANEPEQIRNQTWKGESFDGILRGKVAVVTGAARGIGRSIAVDFAANGADVIGIDICREVSPILEYQPASSEQLDQTGDLVKSHGRRWLALTADIRKLDELRAAADRISSEFGGIDIVVANAAIQSFKPLLEMDDAHWHDVIDNNLNGTANTVRAFAPHLVRRGAGR